MTNTPIDRRSLRGARRAVREMNPMERAIFLAMRFENASYQELGDRFGIGAAEVEAHFASSIVILVRAMRAEDRPWWKFWRRWGDS